jgi:hypothetical protein
MNMKEFQQLPPDKQRAYATEQVAFWRAIQRNLDRIDTAETAEEKAAITAKIATADVAAIDTAFIAVESVPVEEKSQLAK